MRKKITRNEWQKFCLWLLVFAPFEILLLVVVVGKIMNPDYWNQPADPHFIFLSLLGCFAATGITTMLILIFKSKLES